MCEAFNTQYGTDYIAVMPTNLYGPGDNYNLEKSHVLPALIRKIHLAKCLESNDWCAIRKDLNNYPIKSVDGNSDIAEIIQTLGKFGIKILFENCSDDNNPEFIDKELKKVSVEVWGTGTPFREFMLSYDMAEACVFLMENISAGDILKLNMDIKRQGINSPQFLNIGTGEEVSIKELAFRIAGIIGYKGEISFDHSKPDGTMRKTTDTTVLKLLGYSHEFSLDKGLTFTYKNYLKNLKD
jgi:GDP-L-fucose synthase